MKIDVYSTVPKLVKAFNVDHFWDRAFINVTSILDGDVLYVHLSVTMASLRDTSTISKEQSEHSYHSINRVAQKNKPRDYVAMHAISISQYRINYLVNYLVIIYYNWQADNIMHNT